MNNFQSSLILAVLGAAQTSAQAALPADAILTFDPGQPVSQDVTDSCFAIDFNDHLWYVSCERIRRCIR